MQKQATLLLKSKLLTARQDGFSWRAASMACNVLTADGKPNPSLAQRIAEKGYEPKGKALRSRLGLVDGPAPELAAMVAALKSIPIPRHIQRVYNSRGERVYIRKQS